MNDPGKHALHDIHSHLLNERAPRRLYDAITEMVRVALSADCVSLLLWENGGLMQMALVGQPLQAQVGQRVVPTQRFAHQVALNGRPKRYGVVDHNAAQASPRLEHGYGERFDNALLTVPLLAADRVVGVLQAERISPSFSLEDQELLQLLAGQVTTVVEHARHHASTAASETLNRALLESASDGVLLLDSKGLRVIDANLSMEQLSGYNRSDLQAFSPMSLFGETWQTHYRTLLDAQGGPVRPFETLLRTSDQVTIPVSVGISRVTYGREQLLLLIVRDISHQQRVAQQLVDAEKLAAIGRLAASIAHEVNNPLQAIYNSLDLLRKNHMAAEKRQRYLDLTFAEAERLIDIVKRLIDFHRPTRDGMRPTQIVDLLEGLLTSLGDQIQQHKVMLIKDWQTPQPRVLAIHSHLKQVCSNLIVNALDAMPDGGTLTIRVHRERDVRDNGKRRDPDAPGLLVVEFCDTGHGIAPHDIHKIFEPFYTTKVSGTGLGLAISYNIVQQHGGDLTAISSSGNGTIFRLQLPAVE